MSATVKFFFRMPFSPLPSATADSWLVGVVVLPSFRRSGLSRASVKIPANLFSSKVRRSPRWNTPAGLSLPHGLNCIFFDLLFPVCAFDPTTRGLTCVYCGHALTLFLISFWPDPDKSPPPCRQQLFTVCRVFLNLPPLFFTPSSTVVPHERYASPKAPSV